MKKRVTGILLAAVMAAALMMTGCSVTDTIGSLLNKDTMEEETTTEDEEESEEVEEEEEIVEETENSDKQFGTSQNDAVEVSLNTKVYGTLSSGYYWCSFTTGSDINAEYRITLIDKSADSHSIIAKVYDEYGTQLGSGEGYADGLAVTFSPENLETNTTYYVCLSLWQEVETSFMMVVRDGNEMESGIGASDSTDSDFDTDNIIIATNMDDAPAVPSGSKIESSMESGNHYYAFTPSTTGEYKFTVVDITADSHSAIAKVYDEYGTELGSGEAYSDGTAVTFTAGELTAGRTYYVRVYLWQEVYTGYTITIHEPEAPEEEDTAEIISEDDNTAVIIEDESDKTGSGDDNTAVIIEE